VWYIRSMQWFQHPASVRPPKRRRHAAEAHGDGDDDPMDVDPYQEKWETLARLDSGYTEMDRRMKAVEDEMERMRVSENERHSVSGGRPTTYYGSTPVQFSQQVCYP